MTGSSRATGWSRVTSAAVDAAAAEGVKLETTYTGKALAALLGDVGAGLLGDQRVLFWDTYNSAPCWLTVTIESLPTASAGLRSDLRRAVRPCTHDSFGRRHGMTWRGFGSDNHSGVHPEVLSAIGRANEGHAHPYGDDPWTAAAHATLRRAPGRRV